MLDRNTLFSVVSNLKSGKESKVDIVIKGVTYSVILLPPDSNKEINIPSIMMIPKVSKEKMNNQICIESNNLETNIIENIIVQGYDTANRLAELTLSNPAPIVIPLLPSEKNEPYYQQLSKECFDLLPSSSKYRMDAQVVRVINNAKEILRKDYGVIARDKVFLNGYSSSGVFAQRFALIHPEIVETACIGGASGSIPIPTKQIGYPIGIEDFEKLFGKKFDMRNYEKIKFRYYVGELETANKANDRVDDDGNPAPMHDMSYFDRSVPTEVGKEQRKLLGNELLKRAESTVFLLLSKAHINIKHTIIPGRTHNNRSGHGVNELGDKFIVNTYNDTINKQSEMEH